MLSHTIKRVTHTEVYPYHLTEAYQALRQELERPTLKTLLYHWVTGKTTFDKVQDIYNLTDQLTAHLAPSMECKKGCHHCCKADIPFMDIEADYIENKTGLVMTPAETQTPKTSRPNVCHFLRPNGTCRIYEHRPFVCRTLLARDSPLFCEEGKPRLYHQENDVLLSGLYDMLIAVNRSRSIQNTLLTTPIKALVLKLKQSRVYNWLRKSQKSRK